MIPVEVLNMSFCVSENSKASLKFFSISADFGVLYVLAVCTHEEEDIAVLLLYCGIQRLSKSCMWLYSLCVSQ